MNVQPLTNVTFSVSEREALSVWRRRAGRPAPAAGSGITITLPDDSPYPHAGQLDFVDRAVDPQTGEELWQYAAKQRVDSSPVIVGDRVFVGSADGRLYELDLKTGQQNWEYESGAGFPGSPAVAGGKLVIASDDGVVYCFGEKQ